MLATVNGLRQLRTECDFFKASVDVLNIDKHYIRAFKIILSLMGEWVVCI